MARKQTSSLAANKAVSLERAARLFGLLQFLATGSKARAAVLRKLRVDIRTFYRDLEFLRDCSIIIELTGQKYSLAGDARAMTERLPFPDPGLTLGEATVLTKGRSAVHKKLKKLVQQITH